MAMQIRSIWVLVPVLALILAACNDNNGSSQAPAENEAVINGTVLDGTSDPSTPISGASVSGGGQSAQTDAEGKFSLRLTTDSPTTVGLFISKTAYRDTTVLIDVQPGESVSPTVFLSPKSMVTGGSRAPKSIAFLGASPTRISVYGVGGTETTYLGWEVRDSVGRALDADNAVDINFRLVNGPGGGEYVSPATRRTDPNGQTYISLGAGTRSGIVQVVAEVLYGGNTIQSSPVRIVIDGGFPVQERFTIAAPYYNFAAMNWVNRTLPVTVLVGDVYSNPVAENTAVYFRSGAGVIQPRVYTSTDGQGTVDLISGNPRPFGAFAAPAPLDTGYHYVVARTIGQNGVAVTDSILILWSGASTIKNLSPSSFAIPNGGSQVFTFSVCDAYHHPLQSGTEIAVLASVPPPPDPNTPMNQVQVGFGVGGRIELRDYLFRGPGTTDFSFVLSDGTTNINQATSVVLTIAVTGPNGNVSYTISGTAQ
jgi:hypothetical protein